jgi:hypothetical protein
LDIEHDSDGASVAQAASHASARQYACEQVIGDAVGEGIRKGCWDCDFCEDHGGRLAEGRDDSDRYERFVSVALTIAGAFVDEG